MNTARLWLSLQRSGWVLMLVLGLSRPVCGEDLLSIYQQALVSAPELKAAGLKVAVGEAQKGEAFGQMLPQVNGVANWSGNDLQQGSFGQTYSGTRYYVSLTQSLMDFAKYWEWQRSREQQRQFDAEQLTAQQSLLFEVVKRYFLILDAEEQLGFIKTEKQSTEIYQQQINKLFAKQMTKITEVYEVEARLDQIKADEIEAESLLLTARQSLMELTNSASGELRHLREAIEYKELDGKLEDWLEVAKSENPTLSAHHSAVQAAQNDVAVRKAKHLPVVDLQLYYYDTDTGYQSVRTNHMQTQVAALNVNVPIFSGGVLSEAVSESQSKLAIVKEENEAKLRALIKETSEAYTLSNANAKRIAAAHRAVSSAAKSREAMQSGFNYGVKTIREVLEAQQAELKAKRDLARAKYNYIINRVRFLRAIGTISEDNLLEINHWLEG